MNASQIHLALTHVPVILSFTGLVILIIAFIRKNDSLAKTSLYLLLIAGIFAVPVYLSGEGSEEIVEHLPGVSENIIEEHEEFASIGLAITAACGLISLIGLIMYKMQRFTRIIRMTVFLLALGSAAAMAQTAHLGGQIRHTELNSTADKTAPDNNTNEGGNEDD